MHRERFTDPEDVRIIDNAYANLVGATGNIAWMTEVGVPMLAWFNENK